MNKNIQALLYSIGITGNYIGFHQVASAIEIAVCNPQSLLMVTKGLYLDIAQQYQTDWKAVERNIRSVIAITWRCSRRNLEKIAGHSLPRKPTPTQFIAIMSRYVQEASCT